MEDLFIIYYNKSVLVVVKFKTQGITPEYGDILNWYAKEYGFEREKLSGCYAHSINVEGMSYNDFAKFRSN
jgi:hypothetical protein